MDTQMIISVIGLLGIGGTIGGIIGSYFQHLWEKKKESELRIQNINENRYRSILVYMRCFLKPKSLAQFQIEDKNIYKLKKEDEIKKYAKDKITEYYYNGFLYASDEVIVSIKNFIEKPTEVNFTRTAIAMRKDLWGKTKMNVDTLFLKD